MFKIIGRLFVLAFSKIFKTDRLSEKFPVSIKAIIKNKEGYLLLKNERGEWDFPGGKIKSNTIFINNLKREVKEETNLTIKPNKLVYLDLKKSNQVDVIIAIYFVNVVGTENIRISFEHHSYSFYSKTQITKLKTPEWVLESIKKLDKNNSK